MRKGRIFEPVIRESLLEIEDVANLFLEAILDFKRRRRYHRFIKIKSVAPLLMKGGMKKSFFDVVNQLERLRCLVLYMPPTKFYRLVSEFIVSPHGVKFYPVRHIFGEGYLQEEFLERVEEILSWICDICEDDEDTEWVTAFISQLKEKIRVFDTMIDFRSKDWYCVKSVVRFNDVKDWTENEFLAKLRNYYSSRRKKITAEMVLADLVRGELDVTPIAKTEEKKIKKKERKEKEPEQKVAETIKISEWRGW